MHGGRGEDPLRESHVGCLLGYLAASGEVTQGQEVTNSGPGGLYRRWECGFHSAPGPCGKCCYIYKCEGLRGIQNTGNTTVLHWFVHRREATVLGE